MAVGFPFLVAMNPVLAQGDLPPFFEAVQPPVRIGIPTGPSAEAIGGLFAAIQSFDSMSIVASELTQSFSETDVAVFLIPSWEYLSEIEVSGDLSDYFHTVANSNLDGRWTFARLEFDGSSQIGLIFFVVEEDTLAE